MPVEPKNDDEHGGRQDVDPALLKIQRQARRYAATLTQSKAMAGFAGIAMAGSVIAGIVNALYNSKLTSTEIWNVSTGAAVLAAAVVWVLNYLSPKSKDTIVRDQSEQEEQILQRRMLKKSLEVFDEVVAKQLFTDEDKAQMLKRLEENMTADAVMSYHSSIMADTQSRAKESMIPRHFHRMYDRLSAEVEAQARRGNLNLILGILTTAMGLGILGYSVYFAPGGKLEDLIAYFAPRLTLGILVQVFSYFFLRLYKQSLSEIKYFQNEITNIESHQLAILMAKTSDDAALPSRIVETLMKVERNFLMNKDQTTIELERERIEQSKVSELIQAVKEYTKPRS